MAPYAVRKPYRPAGWQDIFNRTEETFVDNFWTCVILFAAAQSVSVVILIMSIGAQMRPPGAFGAALGGMAGGAGQDMFRLAWLLSGGLAQGLLAPVVTAAFQGRRIGPVEAAAVVGPAAGRLIVAAFIVSLPAIGAYRLLLAPGAVTKLFAAPAFLLYVVSYVAIPVSIFEKTDLFRALVRSWRLVWMQPSRSPLSRVLGPWRILMLSLSAVLLAGAVAVIGAFVVLVFLQVVLSFLPGLFSTVLSALDDPAAVLIVQTVFMCLFCPVVSMLHTVIYYDIRRQHEGYDPATCAPLVGEGPSA